MGWLIDVVVVNRNEQISQCGNDGKKDDENC